MSNFLFENVLLTVNLQSTSNLFEWEGASLITKTGALSTLSFEFFFSYFNLFSAVIITTPFIDAVTENYFQHLFTVGTFFQFSNLYTQLHVFQWSMVDLLAPTTAAALINYRGFFDNSIIFLFFFSDTVVPQLYNDFIRLFISSQVNDFYSGTFISTIFTNVDWLFEICYSFDWLLIIVECLFLVFLLNFSSRVVDLFSNIRIFYDDIITFCKLNNISVTEVGVFFSFFLGFIVFDIFICSVDEDVTDVFSYFMVTFVVLLFFFLILGTDVQYYYMISSVSSGDLTTRVIAFDVINNFLCILRIFFCWVRYIFYDLQVELVDFTFHYTDSINDLTVLSLFDNSFSSAWYGDIFSSNSDSSILSVTRATGWIFIYIYLDVSFIILQMLLGFVKLFIAFFLLWLIVDLFILKAFAHSESTYFNHLRARK